MKLLKHLIKKYLWKWVFYQKIYDPAVLLNRNFLTRLNVSPYLSTEKLNVFTTAGEDGILLGIFNKIGHGNKVFIDIGSNDCINSNCANLAFHHGWSGTFIDGNKNILERGRYIYQRHFKRAGGRFSFIHRIVTPANINEILSGILSKNEIDLLSIDLDGNDYFIWDSISSISPRVVVAEVQVEKGNTNFIPPYASEFEPYETNVPKGASPLSMKNLAETKGYSLVATNKGCYNLFFVRNDCMQFLNELSIEEALKNT